MGGSEFDWVIRLFPNQMIALTGDTSSPPDCSFLPAEGVEDLEISTKHRRLVV